MQAFYDYKKFAILYVDDEEKSLKYFQRAFADVFRIYTAPSAAGGLRVLEEHRQEIAIILTDQRMPEETGVEFLEKTRRVHPRAIRILVTAFSNLNDAIAAVNTGAIYKYITKPWDVPMLEITLKRAFEFYIIQNDRDTLLREKLSALHKLVITDRVISLGVLASGLGHHIRNAMVAIRTFIDLAPEMLHREQADLDELQHPEFWSDFYEKVQGKVHAIIDLLDGLDTASVKAPPASGDWTLVRLREVVDTSWISCRGDFERAGLSVEFQIPASLPEIEGDRPKLRRLFDLIFREALINLSEGNTLKIVASPDSSTSACLLLRISDDGPGLPEDAVNSLFDPFFLRVDEPQEFGLNLMACYFIVYHHGGRIEAKSHPDNGLELNIHLPLKARPLAAENEGREFLAKVMNNDRLWEKLLAEG